MASSQPVLTYLQSLDPNILNDLYQDAYTCLTIFRTIPDVAKHVVLRLLMMNEPVAKSVAYSWMIASPGATEVLDIALER